MKRYFSILGILVLCLFGCSEDPLQENDPATLEAQGLYGAPLGDDVVLQTMYESEVLSLAENTPVQIVTVLDGTSRVTLNARFHGVRDLGYGFPLYECELTDVATDARGGIAGGMSGSPVGPPGRVMGALAYGVDFSKAPHRFWVTAIDAMESAKDRQTLGDLLAEQHAPAAPAGHINSVYTPVKIPFMVTGVPHHQLKKIESLLKGAHFGFIDVVAGINGAPQAPPVNTRQLAAGDMIGIAVATGDIVNSIGYGTVTQVYDDNTFVAMGHPMLGTVGKVDLPVYRAVVNGLVPSYERTNKSVSVYGDPIGTITKDLTPGIVGKLGASPAMIPVNITYQLEGGDVVEKYHEVAHGQELYIAVIASGTLGSIRQEKSPGTIDATVLYHFEETDTIWTDIFRYAVADPVNATLSHMFVSVSAFADMLENAAEKATVQKVDITFKDTPQIRLAEVLDVRVPEKIVPGESATLTVVLLPHWSAALDGRTIEKEVTLEIPQDFPEGAAYLTVTSQYVDGAPEPLDSLFAEFDFDFDFDADETSEPAAPQTLEQLIQQRMADQIVDPGLINIVLSVETDEFDFDLWDDEDPFAESDPVDPIETQISIEDFIVTGEKRITVNITVELHHRKE